MKEQTFTVTFRDKRDGSIRQGRAKGATLAEAQQNLLEAHVKGRQESERILNIASGGDINDSTTIDDFELTEIDPNDKSTPLVIDWQTLEWASGVMVQRSPHWMKERCIKGRPQIGIVIGFEHYEDAKGVVTSWPAVKWEGDRNSGISSTHPMNVTLYRKDARENAPLVVMNLEEGEYRED